MYSHNDSFVAILVPIDPIPIVKIQEIRKLPRQIAAVMIRAEYDIPGKMVKVNFSIFGYSDTTFYYNQSFYV